MTAEQFSAAYERYAGQIRAYCLKRIGPDAADDVAADVWLDAWQAWPRYEDRGFPVSAWLYRIARSQCADYVRDRVRRPTVELDPRLWHHDPTFVLVETVADIRPLLVRLRSPAQRLAIELRVLGYGLTDSARLMGATEGSVKALLNRARAHLEAMDRR